MLVTEASNTEKPRGKIIEIPPFLFSGNVTVSLTLTVTRAPVVGEDRTTDGSLSGGTVGTAVVLELSPGPTSVFALTRMYTGTPRWSGPIVVDVDVVVVDRRICSQAMPKRSQSITRTVLLYVLLNAHLRASQARVTNCCYSC